MGWVESCAAPWEGEGGEFYCEHGICVRIGQEIPDLRSSFKNNVALNFNRGLLNTSYVRTVQVLGLILARFISIKEARMNGTKVLILLFLVTLLVKSIDKY